MTAAILSPAQSPNKSALTAVVLIHGAALAALLLAKGPEVIRTVFDPTDIYDVSLPPPPPPKELPKPKIDMPPPPETMTRPPPQWDVAPPPRFTYDPRPTTPNYALNTTPGDIVAKPVDVQVPPEPRKLEPAHARANLGSYVSDADYPASAIRDEQQGTTRFRLTVGADGRVSDCVVTGSSGSAALDATTCRLMKSRARFTPARDGEGRPAADVVANAIRWVLPDA
jgi:protein TonB